MTPKNQPMNQINKIILCGLLLCLLGAAGKGYGQEVKWKLKLGSVPVDYPVIGKDGTVYIGSGAGIQSFVYAINGKTGKEKWRKATAGWIRSFRVSWK